MGLLRNCTEELVMEEMGKAKLDAFFPWSLWVKPVFRNPRLPGPMGKSRASPRDLVMHPSALRALASVIVKSIPIIFGRSRQLGEDPED